MEHSFQTRFRNHLPALALATATSVAAFLLPYLALRHAGPGSLIRSAWSEGVSLSTYGKWWVNAPHRFLVDAFSGEFPVFYNFLSDALINVIAKISGLPPMSAQVLIYAPALVFLFIWLSYVSLFQVFKDRWIAWIGTALIAFGGNSQLGELVNHRLSSEYNEILHVPVHTLFLGVANSLGWVLYLPALAWMHMAYETGSRKKELLFGVLFGLLFLSHTLTFLSAGMSLLVYITIRESLEIAPEKKRAVYFGLLTVVAGAFTAIATKHQPFPFNHLVPFWIGAVAINFLFSKKKSFYLFGLGSSALIALPYVISVFLNSKTPGDEGHGPAIRFGWLLIYFFPYLIAMGVALFVPKRMGKSLTSEPPLLWSVAIFIANLFLAYNYVWRWGSHPYRFAIQLLFPLAIFSAYVLRHTRGWATHLLSAWLLGIVAFNLFSFYFRNRPYVNYQAIPEAQARFYKQLERSSAKALQTDPTGRLLAPTEFEYPTGSVQTTLLINFSHMPTFVPDVRYQLWNERYKNRMGVFCFLFPDYPHLDRQTGYRACADTLEPTLFEILEPKLKTASIPLYSLRLAAAAEEPFASVLRRASTKYGWTPVSSESSSLLITPAQAALPGTGTFSRATYETKTGAFSTTFEIAETGAYTVLIAARNLKDTFAATALDGAPAEPFIRNGNWLVLTRQLSAGPHRLSIEWQPGRMDQAMDSVYFVSAIRDSELGKYLRFKASSGGAANPLRDSTSAPARRPRKGNRF